MKADGSCNTPVSRTMSVLELVPSTCMFPNYCPRCHIPLYVLSIYTPPGQPFAQPPPPPPPPPAPPSTLAPLTTSLSQGTREEKRVRQCSPSLLVSTPLMELEGPLCFLGCYSALLIYRNNCLFLVIPIVIGEVVVVTCDLA